MTPWRLALRRRQLASLLIGDERPEVAEGARGTLVAMVASSTADELAAHVASATALALEVRRS